MQFLLLLLHICYIIICQVEEKNMFVDQRILEDLCRDAGATRKDKAIKYQKQGKVEIRKLDYKNNKNFEIVAKVHGTDM